MVFHRAGGGRSDALPTNTEDLFQAGTAAPTQAADVNQPLIPSRPNKMVDPLQWQDTALKDRG